MNPNDPQDASRAIVIDVEFDRNRAKSFTEESRWFV